MAAEFYVDIIAAVCGESWGIGLANGIPWRGSPAGAEDMRFFKSMTRGSAIIVGRKTYESFGGQPLPDRTCIVVSGTLAEVAAGFLLFPTYVSAEAYCREAGLGCFAAGGRRIYEAAHNSPYIRYAYITEITGGDYSYDTYYPREYLEDYRKTALCYGLGENSYYAYNPPHGDQGYKDLVREILLRPPHANRTSVMTRALPHRSVSYILSEPGRGPVLPLLTLKETSFRNIYYELVWFLRAEQDTSFLTTHGVKIWDGNTSREYLDSIPGLSGYEEGHAGPIYGCQWRRWRCQDGNSIDQLQAAIDVLKKDKWSRRAVVSAWNPPDLDKMVLPPCHYSFQFSYCDRDQLNCIVNMRSTDVALGLPYNVASYALLTHMVALILGARPGILTIMMGDAHIYESHCAQMETVVGRQPRLYPSLRFSERVLSKKNITIDCFSREFGFGDYKLDRYEPHSRVLMQMVAK